MASEPVRIIVTVHESPRQNPVGQFVLNLALPSVPRAGEWVHVAGVPSRVMDVVWIVGDKGYSKVELFLAVREISQQYPDTLVDLKSAGFVPLDQHGEDMRWEDWGSKDVESSQEPVGA